MIAMGQLFTSDQITQNLTTIGHRMAFENEQNRYCIVNLKGTEVTNVNNSKEKRTA